MGNIDTTTSQAIAVQRYMAGIREVGQEYLPLVTLHSDNVAALRIAGDTGVGAPTSWDGASPMTTRTVDQSWPLLLEYTEHALQVRLPKRRNADTPGLAGDIGARLGSEVGQYMRSLVETHRAGMFTGTGLPGSKPLISTTHPTDIGTRSNGLTSALDRTALMAAMALLRNWRTKEGTRQDMSRLPKVLEIGLELVDTAAQLLNAALVPTATQPATGQKTLAEAYGIVGIVYNYELDANSWSLTVQGRSPIHLWFRDQPVYDAWIDSETKALCQSVDWAQATGSGPLPDGIVGANVT